MVRLSDFIHKDKRNRPEEPRTPPHVTAPTPTISKPASPIPHEAAGESLDLESLYEKLVACAQRLFEQARTRLPLDLAEAIARLEQLPQPNTAQAEAVLSLIERHTEENYLYSHSVNVALLAYHLGSYLGYTDASARQLALAGLLHDIGMAGEPEEVAALPRRLTADELQIISQHPTIALEYLKTAQELSREALKAIGAHHEHQKGQGYPSGLLERLLVLLHVGQEPTVRDYANILAVCDVYDALTHPRSYRKRFSPAQAIKLLIDGAGDQFDHRVVKTLVNALSLYPRGSVVKLNTNEVGVVERIHPEALLRPVVLVSRDGDGNPLPTPRHVDLLEQPFTYIKGIVAEEEPKS